MAILKRISLANLKTDWEAFEKVVSQTDNSIIFEIIENEQHQKVGCDTAKQVLTIPRDELIKRTDLEEETIDDVLRILSAEFEDSDARYDSDEEYEDQNEQE